MAIIDYVILAAYLLFLLTLGPIFNRFNRNASDYFRAGGTMVWWIAATAVIMGGFSAWSFTGGAARVYETGTFFLALFLCNFVAMAFTYRFLAARFRQMRVVTAVEAIRKRFGPVNEQVFTWIQIPQNLFFAGIGLYTLVVFSSGAFGLPMMSLILILGTIVTVMAVAGGAWAINAGQFVQSLIFLAITGMMVWTTLSHPQVGGLSGLIRQLPEQHFNWAQIERPSVLLAFVGTLLLGQLIQMNSLKEGVAKYLIVKNGRDARRVTLLNIAATLLLTPMWMIPAMGSVIVHPTLSADYPGLKNAHEAAYVAMAQTTLPPGLLGLLLCAIFSASLDNLSSGVNGSAAVLVRNFYVPIINPKASDRRQVWIGRVLSVLGGGIIVGVALAMGKFSTLPLYNLVLLCAAAIGLPQAIPMFLGLFVRRAPSISLWSTLLIGFSTSLALQFVLRDALLNRLWRAGDTPLTRQELSDLKIAVITGVLIVVCMGWFFLCTLLSILAERRRCMLGLPVSLPAQAQAIVEADLQAPGQSPAVVHLFQSIATQRLSGFLGLFDDTPQRRAQVEAFFIEMNTPIDDATEHGDSAQKDDHRQYHMLGMLSVIFGGFIAVLGLLPNTLGGRLGLLGCGGGVALVGMLLLWLARRASIRSTAVLVDISDATGLISDAGQPMCAEPHSVG